MPVIEAFSDNRVTLGPYSDPVTVTSTGNVGIGTAVPTGQNANGPVLHLFGKNASGTLNEPQIVFQQTGEPAMSIGVNANLLPTTGMTLPFLSYGGSSLLSSGIIAGVLLNYTSLTEKNE